MKKKAAKSLTPRQKDRLLVLLKELAARDESRIRRECYDEAGRAYADTWPIGGIPLLASADSVASRNQFLTLTWIVKELAVTAIERQQSAAACDADSGTWAGVFVGLTRQQLDQLKAFQDVLFSTRPLPAGTRSPGHPLPHPLGPGR